MRIPEATIYAIANAFLAGQSVTRIAERGAMRKDTVERVLRDVMRGMASRLHAATVEPEPVSAVVVEHAEAGA